MSKLPPPLPLKLDLRIDDASVTVRHALSQVTKTLQDAHVGQESVGTVEIVIAEALNNVLEHAYAETGPVKIDLSLSAVNQNIIVAITDTGAPMPNLTLPEGKQANLDVATQDLPEGGFGWFLIHEMTEALTYQRHESCNILTLNIPTTCED